MYTPIHLIYAVELSLLINQIPINWEDYRKKEISRKKEKKNGNIRDKETIHIPLLLERDFRIILQERFLEIPNTPPQPDK